MIYAFNDSADGYYQVDVPEGHDLPAWTNSLTPCVVHAVNALQVTRNVPTYIFRDRFTEAELIAINALAYSGDAAVQFMLLKVSTATDGIDLRSQSVADGLNYLVSVGAITSGRLLEILTPN